ncbi:MAG: hypothetical protein ACLQIB_24505 [Isosphaeraceae bacterium]
MKEKRKEPDRSENQPAHPAANEVPLRSAGDVVVVHQESAAKAPPEKQIHPRRPLPLIPISRGEAPRESDVTNAPDQNKICREAEKKKKQDASDS